MSIQECIQQLQGQTRSGPCGQNIDLVNVTWARTFRANISLVDAQALATTIVDVTTNNTCPKLQTLELHYSKLEAGTDANTDESSILRAFLPLVEQQPPTVFEFNFRATTLTGGGNGLAALLDASRKAKVIKLLDLSETGLTELEWRTLVGPALLQQDQLERLSLGSCLEDRKNTTLADLLPFVPTTSLKKLCANGTRKLMGRVPLFDWTPLEKMTQLQDLNLTGCTITNGTGLATAVGELCKTGNFQVMSLGNCQLSRSETLMLLKNIQGLVQWTLSNCAIGDADGMTAMVEALSRCPNLERLDTSQCKIGKVGAKVLAPALHPSKLPNLEHLDVGFNPMFDDGALEVIRECIGQPECRVHELTFYNMGLTNTAAAALQEAISTNANKSLQEVYLAPTIAENDNKIDRNTGMAIRMALRNRGAEDYSDDENH